MHSDQQETQSKETLFTIAMEHDLSLVDKILQVDTLDMS